MRAVATFDVTRWEQTPYGVDDDGPSLSRAVVGKSFSGDLVGESVAELLMCQADPDDLSAGAGYVASERVRGSLEGRKGTFVLQHGGLSGGSGGEHTFGSVVPGSGTGALEGLTGTSEIVRDDEGHRLILEYELP